MSSSVFPRGVPAALPADLPHDGLPGDLDRGAFWFLLHERRPANVVWRSAAIRYHRWSDEHRAWVEELDRVDGGKGLNPWYVDDRRYLEWGAAKIVHDLIDLGDDPTLELKGEAVLREALALADA